VTSPSGSRGFRSGVDAKIRWVEGGAPTVPAGMADQVGFTFPSRPARGNTIGGTLGFYGVTSSMPSCHASAPDHGRLSRRDTRRPSSRNAGRPSRSVAPPSGSLLPTSRSLLPPSRSLLVRPEACSSVWGRAPPPGVRSPSPGPTPSSRSSLPLPGAHSPVPEPAPPVPEPAPPVPEPAPRPGACSPSSRSPLSVVPNPAPRRPGARPPRHPEARSPVVPSRARDLHFPAHKVSRRVDFCRAAPALDPPRAHCVYPSGDCRSLASLGTTRRFECGSTTSTSSRAVREICTSG
jgi:hypothetical protein